MGGPARRRLALCGGVAVVAALAGCGLPPVQPWEKGVLARPAMSFDADRLENALAEHIYASKEAASGGAGVGASGCGCN